MNNPTPRRVDFELVVTLNVSSRIPPVHTRGAPVHGCHVVVRPMASSNARARRGGGGGGGGGPCVARPFLNGKRKTKIERTRAAFVPGTCRETSTSRIVLFAVGFPRESLLKPTERMNEQKNTTTVFVITALCRPRVNVGARDRDARGKVSTRT